MPCSLCGSDFVYLEDMEQSNNDDQKPTPFVRKFIFNCGFCGYKWIANPTGSLPNTEVA